MEVGDNEVFLWPNLSGNPRSRGLKGKGIGKIREGNPKRAASGAMSHVTANRSVKRIRDASQTTERGVVMKAGIIFTGTGPILLLTSYDSLESPAFIQKLETKGIKKFMAYEVPEAMVQEKYGNQYKVIMGDLHQQDDLRVLDYDGHHVFHKFRLKELGQPIYHEP